MDAAAGGLERFQHDRYAPDATQAIIVLAVYTLVLGNIAFLLFERRDMQGADHWLAEVLPYPVGSRAVDRSWYQLGRSLGHVDRRPSPRHAGFRNPQVRARALMRVMQGPFQMAFRRFGDRMRVQGRPLVELETVGAKSGSRRQAVVGSFPEIAAAGPSSWVVVASNTGSARHPAWFLNLAKNPDRVWITTGKRRIKVGPETLEGAERDRAWQEITSLAPGYGRYLEITDRVIPIVRLTQETKDA